MNKSLPLLIAASFLTISSPDLFADDKYTEFGIGNHSCGEWLTGRQDKTYYAMGQWMLGWVSSAGYYGMRLRRTDAAAMSAWMDNFCREHPLDSLGVGVRALIKALKEDAE